jgi:perosamine synthetase
MKKKFVFDFLNIIKKNFNLKKKYFLHEPELTKKDEKIVVDCVKSKYVSSTGSYSDLFEKNLKNFTKSKYVVATVNGTSALQIALKLFFIKKNDEVLLPSLTFVATANAILYCNAIPNFVDVSIKTFGIDPLKLENYLLRNCTIKNKKCFNKKTKRYVRALICVHIFGHACEINKLKLICKKYSIILIEDAAEALGSYYHKKHLGTFGNAGVLSFNGNKIITTGGGGALLLPTKKLYLKAKKLVSTGKEKHEYEYLFKKLGYNYRLPSINASLGVSQLKSIQKLIAAKRKNFLFYKKIFKFFKSIVVFEEPKNCQSNYWLNTILLDNKHKKYKNDIIKILLKNNFYCRPLWSPLHKISYLKNYPKDSLPNTNLLYSNCINLPSSANLLNNS